MSERDFVSRRRQALDHPFSELGLNKEHRGPLTLLARKAVRLYNALTVDRGLDTYEGSVELEHFHSDRVWYEPSGWRYLRRALPKHEVRPSDVFVDFGCGKGLVLLCAARYPFARVVGVEVSPRLSEIARANIRRARRRLACQHIEVVTCDAAEFDVPDAMTHAYFFHPFTGETSRAVLERITASLERRPRRLTLIYALPHLHCEVIATGRFRLVRRVTGGMRPRRNNQIHVYSSGPVPADLGAQAEVHA